MSSVLCAELPFSNYTHDFKGVIDYIWYGHQQLTATHVLESVTEAVASVVTALPNPHFASDHVSLMARFVKRG